MGSENQARTRTIATMDLLHTVAGKASMPSATNTVEYSVQYMYCLYATMYQSKRVKQLNPGSHRKHIICHPETN